MTVATQSVDGGVVVLTLDDPERRNPLGHDVRLQLVAALAEAETNDAVAAVVLTGAGGNFSVGGDIRDQAERSLSAQRERFAVIADMVGRMARFSKPLVAAVEGWSAGGGMALAMACPVTVASRDAKFVASFTRIGLIPDMGLLGTLPARVGPARARRIIMSNRIVDAEEAERIGMVDTLAEPGTALEAACEIAQQEAAGAPLPRHFLADWFARDVEAALAYERQLQPLLINSADAAEGRTAFLEKREAQFKGA